MIRKINNYTCDGINIVNLVKSTMKKTQQKKNTLAPSVEIPHTDPWPEYNRKDKPLKIYVNIEIRS